MLLESGSSTPTHCDDRQSSLLSMCTQKPDSHLSTAGGRGQRSRNIDTAGNNFGLPPHGRVAGPPQSPPAPHHYAQVQALLSLHSALLVHACRGEGPRQCAVGRWVGFRPAAHRTHACKPPALLAGPQGLPEHARAGGRPAGPGRRAGTRGASSCGLQRRSGRQDRRRRWPEGQEFSKGERFSPPAIGLLDPLGPLQRRGRAAQERCRRGAYLAGGARAVSGALASRQEHWLRVSAATIGCRRSEWQPAM